MTKIRSTNVAVRKSPSVSATVYPKGFKMKGNDGNIWEIIYDNRGVHRWQKTHDVQRTAGLVESVKKSIEGLRMLLEEDPREKSKIEEIIKKRIQGLDELAEDGDEEAGQSARMLRNLLRESFKHGGRISKLEQQEEVYMNTLRKTKNQAHRALIIKKLEDIDKQKKSFK